MKKELIGRKVKGFKFESRHLLGYIEKMDFRIGSVGGICSYSEWNDSYKVVFENGRGFNYPADQIEKHLLPEEPKMISILESEYNDLKKESEGYKSLVESWKSKYQRETYLLKHEIDNKDAQVLGQININTMLSKKIDSLRQELKGIKNNWIVKLFRIK